METNSPQKNLKKASLIPEPYSTELSEAKTVKDIDAVVLKVKVAHPELYYSMLEEKQIDASPYGARFKKAK